MKSENERYHDRIAHRYDDIYGSDPYWDFYRELSWSWMRPHLPGDAGPEVADLGCGTGAFGLRLLRSGYRVVFSDLSERMLDAARRRVAEEGARRPADFVRADICDLAHLGAERFSLACLQGDALSFCSDARRALREIRGVLRPDGVMIASVDATWGAMDAFVTREDWDGLASFVRTGRSEWLARDPSLRFPIRTFRPGELRELVEAAGFRVVSLVGKTALPIRALRERLADPMVRRRLMGIEMRLGATEAALGRAAHLQIAARRSDAVVDPGGGSPRDSEFPRRPRRRR